MTTWRALTRCCCCCRRHLRIAEKQMIIKKYLLGFLRLADFPRTPLTSITPHLFPNNVRYSFSRQKQAPRRQQGHRRKSPHSSILPPADPSFYHQYDPLIPPALLRHDLPVPPVASKTISASRRTTSSIVRGTDPLSRLVVVVGPCSIHDVDQAQEYASRLRKGVQEGRWPGLEVVMRVYL